MIGRARPVAVTGLGVISAAGLGLAQNMAVVDSGNLAPGKPPFATDRPFPVFACQAVPELPPQGKACFRSVALAVPAALEALETAGTKPEKNLHAGIVVGTSVGASLDFFEYYRKERHATEQTLPDLAEITRYLRSNPAVALGKILGWSGPAVTVTNACSSGADAVGLGASWIRSGLCDVVLAGGADALSPINYCGFGSLRLLGQGACRPFDADRDGLTLGEGAGFLLLESEASRRKRGAAALAFVAGYGTATDAWHPTSPHPEALGLTAAVKQALAQAGADWSRIAFINAHGTATLVNDAVEGGFFQKNCPRTPFISTKGVTGHTLGAAGAIEAVFSIAHLQRGLLPASPGFAKPDAALGVAPAASPLRLEGEFALSQSLAFGGNNSVLIFSGGQV